MIGGAARALAVVAAMAGAAKAAPTSEATSDATSEATRDATSAAPRGMSAAARVTEPDPPIVELVTFGVGEELFEAFGHAAICLRYRAPEHAGVCFNYGITEFDAGSTLAWRFLRSTQRFWVEAMPRELMLESYIAEDRDVWVQELPLADGQARAVEARLWGDLDEARRYYVYDHFFDNCATRLRDLLDAATGAFVAERTARYPLTLRQLGWRGLADRPALRVATDLALGRRIDEPPTVWQAMFHPEILRQVVATRLGAPPRLRYKRLGPPFPVEGPSGLPGLVGAGLLFIVPLVVAQARRRGQGVARGWLALGLGGLGLAIWALVIVSPIPAVRINEVVLVAMPLDLALAWMAAPRRRRYALARMAGLALVALLAAAGALRQPLWALIALVFAGHAVVALDLPHGLRARSPSA